MKRISRNENETRSLNKLFNTCPNKSSRSFFSISASKCLATELCFD